jgi:hypothetical protein
LSVLLLGGYWLPQAFNIADYPLVLCLALGSFVYLLNYE